MGSSVSNTGNWHSSWAATGAKHNIVAKKRLVINLSILDSKIKNSKKPGIR